MLKLLGRPLIPSCMRFGSFAKRPAIPDLLVRLLLQWEWKWERANTPSVILNSTIWISTNPPIYTRVTGSGYYQADSWKWLFLRICLLEYLIHGQCKTYFWRLWQCIMFKNPHLISLERRISANLGITRDIDNYLLLFYVTWHYAPYTVIFLLPGFWATVELNSSKLKEAQGGLGKKSHECTYVGN